MAKPVTLEYWVGSCEACGWKGNPTPDKRDAEFHEQAHAQEIHPGEAVVSDGD
jgi:hypothetical protein